MEISPSLERWLMDGSDPAVRRRFLLDLKGRNPASPEIRALDREMLEQGWLHDILALQQSEGQWNSPVTTPHELYAPKYISTNFSLLVLADLGATRETPGISKAVELLWSREGGPEGGYGGSNSEVCFTGNALRMFLQLGYADDPRLQRMIDWLCAAQKADGGWHCFPSDTGTLDCWEALAAFARLPTNLRSERVTSAIARGAEFYLKRELLHEGSDPYAPWTRLHYPVHYYYDYLVGLDVLARLGFARDPRLEPLLDRLESRRDQEGRWWLDAVHPDIPAEDEYQIHPPVYPFILEEPGRPSRWLTLTSLFIRSAAGLE